ncbi:MAG: hypothetical protein LBU88_10380, partial [Treponema sp.]|nr:hypothetical protein [Treponema sp.]
SSSHRTHYVEDPDYLEYYIISQTITHEEITFYLGYYFNSHFFTNEIIFYLTDDEVVRITDSKKNEK